MAIMTTDIPRLLQAGLAAAWGEAPMYPAQWPEIYEVYNSDKAVEIETELKFLGLGQIRAEGAPTAQDSMGQRFTTTYVHRYVALQFSITRQALKDNLYKDKFPMMARALRDSLNQTKEILAASVFNNGFNAAFPIGDGQSFFSTSHPIDTGLVANTPAVQADLTEGSLEAAIIQIQNGFKNQAGLISQTKPKKLLVPALGQFVAERLLASGFRTGTANNDINAVYNVSAVPQGYRVNQFLNANNAWFLLTDAQDGLKHYIREKLETDVYTDFSTDNLLAKAVERYSFGVSNFRSAYGSNGP